MKPISEWVPFAESMSLSVNQFAIEDARSLVEKFADSLILHPIHWCWVLPLSGVKHTVGWMPSRE